MTLILVLIADVFGGHVAAIVCGFVGFCILVYLHFTRFDSGWFSIETPSPLHQHIPLDMFIRNCGPRPVRGIRFDPLKSRYGLIIQLDGPSSLAVSERQRVGFKARADNTDTEYIGITNHFVSFFEGGSQKMDQPTYSLTIRFRDGTTERKEKHVIEGHPLPKGGVSLKIDIPQTGKPARPQRS